MRARLLYLGVFAAAASLVFVQAAFAGDGPFWP